MFNKGDIIKVSIIRKMYFEINHFGVYDGNGGVYHFTGESIPSARIQHSSLTEFEDGGTSYKENILYRKFNADEIITRARNELGSDFGGYNLITNNCEHFAYWCVTTGS